MSRVGRPKMFSGRVQPRFWLAQAMPSLTTTNSNISETPVMISGLTTGM